MQVEYASERIEELSKSIEPAESCNLRYHTKPLRTVKFNPDGDLLFSSCTNGWLAVWRVSNGERIGKYVGHTGAIVGFDINKEGTKIATGGADMRSNIYDIETGKQLFSFDTVVTTKDVSFTADSRRLVLCTDAIMGQKPKVWVYDVASGELIKNIETQTIPTAIRATLDEKIIYGDTEGNVTLIDERSFDLISSKKMHQSKIKSLTPSFCNTYFVSASTDFKSKIIRADNNKVAAVREFLSDSPNNAARVSPDNRMLISAGGVDARDVTTSTGQGNFNVEIFDCATSKLVGYYKTHFGTVNTLDIHPSGGVMASGGEDGVLYLLKMDDSAFVNASFVPIKGSEI
ncbi:translation initiation factor 3 subunit I [Nematocida minor]|uniref:translation initiation factor 3 subunit I n=1 Tax=Nematocida minor TaxID=1912983 RepID=UPI00221F7B6F|nr:translation initiation factor 3 subunit I [Nematocida minor]KAI5191109.1 translation initiation factor 3 subunit I [Nematocida minor]